MAEPLLSADVRKQIAQALNGMESAVRMRVVTSPSDELGAETLQLAQEVADQSELVVLEHIDLAQNTAGADGMGITKTPGIALLRGVDDLQDFGVRLYGLPSGYEFATLIQDLLLVSSGKSGLNPLSLKQLERLDRSVHIQVYVTPT